MERRKKMVGKMKKRSKKEKKEELENQRKEGLIQKMKNS